MYCLCKTNNLVLFCFRNSVSLTFILLYSVTNININTWHWQLYSNWNLTEDVLWYACTADTCINQTPFCWLLCFKLFLRIHCCNCLVSDSKIMNCELNAYPKQTCISYQRVLTFTLSHKNILCSKYPIERRWEGVSGCKCCIYNSSCNSTGVSTRWGKYIPDAKVAHLDDQNSPFNHSA